MRVAQRIFSRHQTPSQLGAYLRHVDGCINPQTVNETTVGNYPLKIDEYLAMGKPVVATTTRAVEVFAEHVHLATGTAQWLQRLEAALADHDHEKSEARIAFVRSHTWEASAGLLYRALAAVEPQPAGLASTAKAI